MMSLILLLLYYMIKSDFEGVYRCVNSIGRITHK